MIAWMQSWESSHDHTYIGKWFGMMTLPRELSIKKGRLIQQPVRELERYRRNGRFSDASLYAEGTKCFDLEIVGIQSRDFRAVISRELELAWEDGRFALRFLDQSEKSVGAGRMQRFEHLDKLLNVRVVGDASSIEVFVNDGELAFSTRYYPQEYAVDVRASSAEIRLWDLVAE
jgi:beta-fructofuranosidase